DEKTGNPATGGNANRGQEVIARTESLLAPDQRADERALEKEGEHAFHCQCLANDRASILGEAGPIGPELKLHRYPGYYADREIETKDSGPEPRGPFVLLISGSQSAPFPINQEPSQSHGELRKQIVVSDGECEVQAMPKRRICEVWIHNV